MKRTIILTGLLSLFFVLASCKSSKGHCDAYGNKSGKIKKS